MKILTGVIIALALLVGIPTGVKVAKKIEQENKVTEIVQTQYEERAIPAPADVLAGTPIKKLDVKKIMTLEDNNIVVFRGPVTDSSVSKAMKELQKKSRRLSKNKPIYLVLDTPGGSVFDGMDFIDFANALPQKVHTITLFAASMGFQFAQNLDKRYIQRNGTLMSHRASLGGLGGQLDGELETRYKMIKRRVDYLDYVAAKRMEMSVEDYKAMIVNEYWVHGFDAVGDKAADEQVLLRCGKSLDGTTTSTFRTFFGPVKVTFSKCPLIKAPEKIEFGRTVQEKNKPYLRSIIKMATEDKTRFVKDIIAKDKFHKIFPR